MILTDLVRAEARAGEPASALTRAAEDLGHLLLEDKPPARVVTGAAQYISALRKNGREAALAMLASGRDELRARTGNPAEYEHLQGVLVQLMERTRSIDAALEGIDLIRIPFGAETEEERLGVFLDLAAHEPEKTLDRTADDYRALLVHRAPGDTLATAGARMCHLLDMLALTDQQERASEVFATIQDRATSGEQGQKSPEQAVQRFSEQLALTGSVDKALTASLLGGISAGPGTVEQGDDFVIIGGIRIPRTKPEADSTPTP